MTGRVIKSSALGDHNSVRALGAPAYQPPQSEHELQLTRLGEQVRQLERALAERDLQIASIKIEMSERYDQGFADGHAAGVSQADSREKERLDLLRRGVQAANARFAADLQAMERLAALLAGECLDIMFGESTARAAAVIDLIRHQVRSLASGALVRIEVSAADFPDDAVVGDVLSAGSDQVVIQRTDLPSGACQMTLELGQAEIGLDQQWGSLRQVLLDIAHQEERT